MKEYNFGSVTSVLHSFFLYEFCDLYLELVKPVVSTGGGGASGTDVVAEQRRVAQVGGGVVLI
jgi:valyl-tRNA synthetase